MRNISMLRFSKEEFLVVKCNILEKEIQKEYGREFDLVADLTANRDSFIKVMVYKDTLGNYDKECLEGFITEGEGSWLTPLLLTDMCNRDIIPQGRYLIDISW